MKVQIQIGLALLLLGFAYSGYEFYDFYSNDVPKYEKERITKEGELSKQQSQLRRLQDFARNIETIKQELRELNLQLESALEHMPRSFNISGLLRKLTMLAQNSGLEIFTFRPRGNDDRKEGTFYSSTDIDFEMRGTFTQTLTFLDQVARLQRIINVDKLNLTLENNGNMGSRGGQTMLRTSAAARTYRFAD